MAVVFWVSKVHLRKVVEHYSIISSIQCLKKKKRRCKITDRLVDSRVLTVNPNRNSGHGSVDHEEKAYTGHGQIAVFRPPGLCHSLPM